MRRVKRFSFLWLATCLTILLFCTCFGEDGPPPPRASVPTGQGAADEVALTAVFYPRQEVTLSSEVSATIVTIRKEMGQSFKKGEVLVELDRRRYEARLARVEAEVETARVTLAAIERLYKDRSKSLIELVEARSQLARAESDRALVQQDLDACTLRAPFDGRLVKRIANEHELVQRGEELLRIVDDGVLRARFLASTAHLTQVRVGRGVRIHIPALAIDVEGRITHVSPAVDPASRTIEAFAEVQNTEGAILGGMIGSLRFGGNEPSEP